MEAFHFEVLESVDRIIMFEHNDRLVNPVDLVMVSTEDKKYFNGSAEIGKKYMLMILECELNASLTFDNTFSIPLNFKDLKSGSIQSNALIVNATHIAKAVIVNVPKKIRTILDLKPFIILNDSSKIPSINNMPDEMKIKKGIETDSNAKTYIGSVDIKIRKENIENLTESDIGRILDTELFQINIYERSIMKNFMIEKSIVSEISK